MDLAEFFALRVNPLPINKEARCKFQKTCGLFMVGQAWRKQFIQLVN